jgi:hypothetical protein
MVSAGFVARVAAAAALACLPLFSGLPDIPAAALSGAIFLAVGWAIGMVPHELREQLHVRRLLAGLSGNGAGQGDQ